MKYIKYFKYLIQIIILISILLVLYGKENYSLLINQQDVRLEYILIPLIIYFSIIFLNKYINIKIYYKIGLSLINILFSCGIGRLWYKLYMNEYTKSDYIINSWILKLKKIWNKSDYISEAENIFLKKNITEFNDLNSYYSKVNPSSMELWREKLREYIVLAEEKKRIIEQTSDNMNTTESSGLMSIITDKYYLIGGVFGLVIAGCIILYVQSDYATRHYNMFDKMCNYYNYRLMTSYKHYKYEITKSYSEFFYPEAEKNKCREVLKDAYDFWLKKRALPRYPYEIEHNHPINYANIIRMPMRFIRILEADLRKLDSEDFDFDLADLLFRQMKAIKNHLDEADPIPPVDYYLVTRLKPDQDIIIREKFRAISHVLYRNGK